MTPLFEAFFGGIGLVCVQTFKSIRRGTAEEIKEQARLIGDIRNNENLSKEEQDQKVKELHETDMFIIKASAVTTVICAGFIYLLVRFFT